MTLKDVTLSRQNSMDQKSTLEDSPRPQKRVKVSPNPASPLTQDESSQFIDATNDVSDAGLEAAVLLEGCGEEQVKEYERSGGHKKSLYVDAFDLVLNTVLSHESHLFSEEETEVCVKYRSLEYEAQYLFVRLFLRKTSTWFRINKLGYYSDISDISAACAILQGPDAEFAETEDAIETLEEAAGLLNLEELKAIAKEAKCSGTNKVQLIASLKKASSGQGRLKAGGQLSLKFDGKGKYENRDAEFVRKILESTGPCIRLKSSITILFHRVLLIFYRSTEWNDKSLTTVILARTMRRNFPHYIVSRTSNIFPARSDLLDFEEAVKLQTTVDEILGSSGVPTKEGLESVLKIFESIWDKWKELVEEEGRRVKDKDAEETIERAYLRRFCAAWVLTRIVHKGVYVLGRFKDYKKEHEVLSALLKQKYFQGARRGGWYQRKALIEENYMAAVENGGDAKTVEEVQKKKWRKIALETCEAGLQDPETHLIYHYELQKRITKLEQKLKVPKRFQHDFGHASLKKPSEKTIFGERIGEVVVGRKTLWRDPVVGEGQEGKTECSVEEMCLSQYRTEGWKGYHSEGGIVRTLFAYLFYDILFLYLPNVFQTEFQTCPLDLFTDAFYLSRASEINHRLVEIANGGAAALIKSVDSNERERQTCVVGLDWSYATKDLLEIVECMGGEALAVICKMLCQEYRQRASGIPDLFLWNPEKKECMFSEVKSENDRLSDTQRLWIHVLSSAGVKVELCAAVAKKGKE